MTVAPFSLIERDQSGNVKRVTPLHFIHPRNIRGVNNKTLARKDAA